jgi:hypothetical protein
MAQPRFNLHGRADLIVLDRNLFKIDRLVMLPPHEAFEVSSCIATHTLFRTQFGCNEVEPACCH